MENDEDSVDPGIVESVQQPEIQQPEEEEKPPESPPIPKARTPKPPVEHDEYAWRHPQHHAVALVGLVLQILALNCILVAEFVLDWYLDDVPGHPKTVNKYANKVICGAIPLEDMKQTLYFKCPDFYLYEEKPYRCTYAEFVKDDSKFQDLTGPVYQFLIELCMWAGIGFTGLSVLLLWLVFWPVWLLKQKVYHVILRAVVWSNGFGVFVKLLAGATITIDGALYYATARRYICSAGDLQYNTFFLGFIFFSAIFEILTIMLFLIALDRGQDGESHLERLAREKAQDDEREKEMQEVKDGKRRRSTYAPDVTSEHSELLKKVSSVIHSHSERSKNNNKAMVAMDTPSKAMVTMETPSKTMVTMVTLETPDAAVAAARPATPREVKSPESKKTA